MADGRVGAERPSEQYAGLIAAGVLVDDPAQRDLVLRLDALNRALAASPGKPRGLARLFGERPQFVKGLYVHGEVGRGKTMLMDAFFGLATPARKRRAHFNEFMADVHERIHAFRQQTPAGAGDPIGPVASALAGEIRLLCLDEFAVEDIADAMILSRLFGELFRQGLVLVATSNSAPEELYRDGLNRALFLPFIDLLKHYVDVVALKSPIDYRLEKLGHMPVYVTPLGAEATAALDRQWQARTGTERGAPAKLTVKGREVIVPQAAKGVARFGFADLCAVPLGNSDYLKIAHTFHTVIVDGIPLLRDDQRDQARRFINLIDTLYDNRIRLIASAAAEPAALYTAAEGDEAFAFRRTVSRLAEMRSAEWLAPAHGQAGQTAPARGAVPG